MYWAHQEFIIANRLTIKTPEEPFEVEHILPQKKNVQNIQKIASQNNFTQNEQTSFTDQN